MQQAAVFRALHASGCFVLPNPWDAGSAKLLQQLGFKALATTSAGHAFARGRPDAFSSLSLEETLENLRSIVCATPLPVNADFQSGYAIDLESLAANVASCVAAGAAGLSIEDLSGDPASPLSARSAAIERVRTARRAIDATGTPAVLTARTEAWLVGHPEPLRTALDRLPAFAEAGADCLYAPGVREPDQIAALVRAVAPKPLNVLLSGPAPGLSLARLEELGVRRVSVGSALARVALGAFMRAAARISKEGSFEALAGAASFDELNACFRGE
jgi:2-methylisocitrate lyase-like PEP mutase family enzyme